MVLNYPAIVGAVADLATLSVLPTLGPQTDACDFLEFRVDALHDHLPQLEHGLSLNIRPTLLTVRDPAEGGVGHLGWGQREALYASYLEWAQLIDLEIANLQSASTLVTRIQNESLTLVGSYHDFEKTPPLEVLKDAADRGVDGGAQILKFAVTTNTVADVATLLTFIEALSAKQLAWAVMGMGPLGMSSRVLFAQCGSLLNYAYLHQANAPGQWAAQTLRAVFNEMRLTEA